MWVPVVVAFLVVAAIATAFVARFVRVATVPAFVSVPVLVALYIPVSIVILVPVDLLSTANRSHPIFYMSETARLAIWRVIYWLAFVLTWAVLPVLQSYVESGYRDPGHRLADSLRSNAKYQAILLGSGCLGLLYVILTSGLSLTSLKALVIALSHCYALVLALWLMGHGMVNIPREMWLHANPKVFLDTAYRRAPGMCESFSDAQASYEEAALEVRSLAQFKTNSKHADWIEELIEEVETNPQLAHHIPASRNTAVVDRSMIDEKYLSALSARLYKTHSRMIRHRSDWQKLLRDCSFHEDILRSQTDGKPLSFRFTRTRLSGSMARIYYAVIRPVLQRGLAILLAAESAILVWSELTHGTRVSLVNIIVSSTFGIAQQLVSSILLGYMLASAFVSLTRIRIFNVYALVHRGSDLSSIIFYATYACRLAVPLSYNYVNLVESRDSAFEEFLGKSINLTPLGKIFNDWLPRLIVVPMLFTLFHFYDKAKQYLSLDLAFDDDEETAQPDAEGSIALPTSAIEGRELVNRALSDPRYRYAIDQPVYNSDYTDLHPAAASSLPTFASRDINRVASPASLPSRTHSPALGSRTLGRQPLLGHAESPTNTGANEALSNVRGFFGSLGAKVQQGVSQGINTIRTRANESNMPRWARLGQSGDDDESMTL